jgi:hypothetical protein
MYEGKKVMHVTIKHYGNMLKTLNHTYLTKFNIFLYIHTAPYCFGNQLKWKLSNIY